MVALVLRRLSPFVVAIGALGCFDFQPDPPAGPSKFLPVRTASITVEYRQPAHCANSNPERCSDLPTFFGSWMGRSQDPIGVTLDYNPQRGAYFWSGVVNDVPVNWPPNDVPHYVVVRDPHLEDTPTAGATAARLIVGGQAIYYYDQPGTPAEAGLIYIDDNGVGHNPL